MSRASISLCSSMEDAPGGVLLIGLALFYFSVQGYASTGFSHYEYIKAASFRYYELNRAFPTQVIFGAVMLLYKWGAFKWFFALLKAPGKMAFIHYLMQSGIALIFFYDIGFGLYGQLGRHQLYLIVSAIWTFQVAFSNLWLHYFALDLLSGFGGI